MGRSHVLLLHSVKDEQWYWRLIYLFLLGVLIVVQNCAFAVDGGGKGDTQDFLDGDTGSPHSVRLPRAQ